MKSHPTISAARLNAEGLVGEQLPPATRAAWQQKLSAFTLLGPHLRDQICDAMVFAIENSRFEFDICELLLQSVASAASIDQSCDDVAAVSKLLARLFLWSDILMNSGTAVVQGTGAGRPAHLT